jgi:hypothetical protein
MNTKDVATKYKELFKHFGAERPDPDFETCGLFHDDEEEIALKLVNKLSKKVINSSNGADRNIGFIQGVLWAIGEFSLNELREHLKDPNTIPTENHFESFDNEDRFEKDN